MNIEGQLMRLLKGGISNINMGINPQGQPFVQCEQVLQTGSEGNLTKVLHQKVSSSLGTCFELLAGDIEHCSKLHHPAPSSNIIQAPRG